MYVVINNEAVWGVGETEAEAIDSAIEWVCSSDENGHRVQDVPIVSYHELRNGADGFAVLPASAEYVGRLASNGGYDFEVVDGVVCSAR